MTLALGFLHPALLWAVPIASVPIIIHLLNRRRFQKVRWAAMEYLLAALKRNRKRLRMEQWLILLLRVLAVMLLVFLVSRPQMSGTVLGEVRTHHVVCLDDSASMAHRQGAVETFKLAKKRIEGLADKLADTRSRDLFSVLRASRARTPDVLGINVGPRLKGSVRDLLPSFAVSDGVADLDVLLEQARLRIEEVEAASRAEIYLVTDLRNSDWLTAEGRPRPKLLQQVMALDPERHHLTVLSVASEDVENLGIVDVRRAGRIAPAGVPLEFTVEVVNRGLQATSRAEVALEIDSKSRVLQTIDGLEPGEHREVTFAHTFQTPGFHGLEASIPRDRYAVDDGRALAIEVVETSSVLLVDGDPGERIEESETFFLTLALEHRESGIGVEVVPDHVLADRDISDVDMIFLCNVPAPDADVVDKLEAFVANGGGLAIFLGNQVDPGQYNQVLYREGKGLLPAPLTDLAGDMDRPDPIYLADPAHATMTRSTEGLEVAFAKLVRVGRYIGVDEAAARAADVILRVRDSEGAPLMVARNFGGGGAVMVFATTADDYWTNLPREIPFLIVTQQMHAVAARVHDDTAYNLSPAGVLRLDLDPGRYRPDVIVRSMAEDGLESTFTASTQGGGEAEAQLETAVDVPMSELRGLGLFEVWLTPHAGERERRLVARNAPPVEGELRKLSRRGLVAALPEELQDRLDVVESEADQAALTAGDGEVWRLLALGMLFALLLESFLAWRFGRR